MNISNPHLINSFNYAALAILILLLGYSLLAGGLNRTHKKLFVSLLSLVLLTTVFAIGGWEFQFISNTKNGKDLICNLREVCNTLYFLGHVATVYLLFLYILEFTSFLTWRKWWVYAIYGSPAFIIFVMAILNPFFGYFWHYTPIDGLYVYERGNLLWLSYLMAGIYSISGFILFFLSAKSLRKNIRYSLYVLFSITYAGVIIQYVFPSYQVEMITETITLAGIMITMEDQIKFIDPISRLANRESFEGDMNKLIHTGHSFTLVIIGLDNFSHFSRVMMKSQSDELITYLAKHLKVMPYLFDVYRVTPYCFALILGQKREKSIGAFKTKLYSFLKEEYHFGDVSYHLACSVTICKVPDELPDREMVTSLIEAREDPLNAEIRFHGIDYIYGIKRRIAVEKAIRRGILHRSFVLYYQPIYSAKTDTIVAAEALCRLNDSELGLISPGEFIPIAEETGMMNEVGDLVYEEACRFIAKGILQTYSLRYVEVNLSVYQLYNENLAVNILRKMERYHIDPKLINLEITESAAVDEALSSRSNLRILMDAGLSFSLDDFGSGYSNYAILDRIPFRNVKLDISLLRNAKRYPQAKVFYHGLISSLSKSGQSLIQEGLEEKSDLDFLREAVPDIMIQGYYFAKPLPEKEFIDYLKNFKGEKTAISS